MNAAPPVPPWRETLGLAVLVATAAALGRLIGIQRLGIAHFDEGQYAYEALQLARHWPTGLLLHSPQHAPPLWAMVLSVAFRWWGAFDCIALALAAAVGGATVGAVFVALDRRAGRPAAWLGAGLLACSPLHLTYSRMALTDGLFAFWYALGLVLALDRLDHGARRRLWASGIALGVVTGLAMWTKYQGSIVWISAVCAEALGLLIDARRRAKRGDKRIDVPPSPLACGRLRDRWGSLALAGALAWAVWLPWRLYAEAAYGPGQMHAQHALFITPFHRWPVELPSHAALIVVILAAGFPAGLAAATVLPMGRSRAEPLPLWVYGPAVWIVLYVAALSVYTPFVRLTLPLTVPLALLGGVGLAAWGRRALDAAPRSARRGIGLSLIAAIVAGNAGHGASVLADRSDGYRLLTERVEALLPGVGVGPSAPRLVRRLGHPMQFYCDDRDLDAMLEPGAPVDRYGRHFYLLTDRTVHWLPASADLFGRWERFRRRIAALPNPGVGLSVFNPPRWRDVPAMFGLRPPAPELVQFDLWEVKLPSPESGVDGASDRTARSEGLSR